MKSVELNRVVELTDINLIGFGDWHYGAPECNIASIKREIELIKKDTKARVILMGDLLNCGTKISIGAGTFDDEIAPQQQYEEVREMLIPIKEKIYGIHIGNHEQRIFNETGIDLMKILSNDLNTKYLGYAAFHDIKINNVHYSIFSTHGSSCSVLPHTKIKACMNLSYFIEADIYMMGHLHSLQTMSQEVKKIDLKNKCIKRHKKYFILTGSFLDYENSYAEMRLLVPSTQGCAKIKLSKLKKEITEGF